MTSPVHNVVVLSCVKALWTSHFHFWLFIDVTKHILLAQVLLYFMLTVKGLNGIILKTTFDCPLINTAVSAVQRKIIVLLRECFEEKNLFILKKETLIMFSVLQLLKVRVY